MYPIVGTKAYDFTAAAIMPDDSIEEKFNLSSYIEGKKCMLLFYPLNFTFVCPSELIALNDFLDDFSKRETNVLSISIDSHFSHLAWKNYLKDNFSCEINYPMVADINKNISDSYGVLSSHGGVALRGSFIIDKNFIVRHALINDFPIGRNIEESLRVLDAIDHHEEHGEVCPAGWKKGKKGMNPTIEGVQQFLLKRDI